VPRSGRHCDSCCLRSRRQAPPPQGPATRKNSAKVDNEGGKATNTITLIAKSAKEAEGSSHSKYTHPGGMVCTWGSKVIELTKQK